MFGIEYQTAAQAVRVCNSIESCLRRQLLTFHHHKEVAGRDDKAELLEWAVKTQATVRELRAEKKRRQLQEQHGVEFAEGCKGELRWQFIQGDCSSLNYEDDVFDLVFCSPPYESQRSYGEVGFSLASMGPRS